MIFVTVGTHEQQFNRLIKCIDDMKFSGLIQEEIIMQTGFSTYKPKYCKWSKFFSYADMVKNVQEARIVITHGGPSSFIAPLQIGKIPIVVPRKKMFEEHINDHQLDFAKVVAERQGNIIVVEEISELEKKILNYDVIILSMPVCLKSNNVKFNEEFKKIVEDIMIS